MQKVSVSSNFDRNPEVMFYVAIVLTFFRREYTVSFTEDDLETRLMMNKPCSESDSFAAKRKDSSTKPASGQVRPELRDSVEYITWRRTW